MKTTALLFSAATVVLGLAASVGMHPGERDCSGRSSVDSPQMSALYSQFLAQAEEAAAAPNPPPRWKTLREVRPIDTLPGMDACWRRLYSDESVAYWCTMDGQMVQVFEHRGRQR